MKKNLVLPLILGMLVSMASNASYAEVTAPQTTPSAPAQNVQQPAVVAPSQQTTPPSVETPAGPGCAKICKPENGKPGFNDENRKEMMEKQRQELDNRLKLSEEQQAQAKEIRLQGREKIKPVMEKMRAKHEEFMAAKKSAVSKEEKQKIFTQFRTDMKALRKEADIVREENLKQFESILTSAQKAEFKKYRDEKKKQRKEFFKRHHKKPCNKPFTGEKPPVKK